MTAAAAAADADWGRDGVEQGGGGETSSYAQLLTILSEFICNLKTDFQVCLTLRPADEQKSKSKLKLKLTLMNEKLSSRD